MKMKRLILAVSLFSALCNQSLFAGNDIVQTLETCQMKSLKKIQKKHGFILLNEDDSKVDSFDEFARFVDVSLTNLNDFQATLEIDTNRTNFAGAYTRIEVKAHALPGEPATTCVLISTKKPVIVNN